MFYIKTGKNMIITIIVLFPHKKIILNGKGHRVHNIWLKWK